jgi:hypothetical protein
MLVDGHEGQLEHIHACIERYRVDVTLILDFIHLLEYLWKAAWCFHPPGSEEAEQWVGDRALQILKGERCSRRHAQSRNLMSTLRQ